jgi:hypothetical protein
LASAPKLSPSSISTEIGAYEFNALIEATFSHMEAASSFQQLRLFSEFFAHKYSSSQDSQWTHILKKNERSFSEFVSQQRYASDIQPKQLPRPNGNIRLFFTEREHLAIRACYQNFSA